MKKFIKFLLMSIGMIFMFVACGGDKEKPGIGFGAQHVRNAGNRHDQRLYTLLR